MESTDVQEVVHATRSASRRAARGKWVEGLGRAGLVAKGISYGLVGVLAAALAAGASRDAQGREGALEVVVDETYGRVLLGVLALGFAAYGLWRLVQALFDRADEGSDTSGLAKRAGYLGRAVVYGALTYTTIRLLLAGSGDGGSETGDARQMTARLLDWPAGRWLVGLLGLVLIGVGIFNAYRAGAQTFEDKWKSDEMSDVERRWAPRLSSLGLASRFVVFSLVGAFLVKAAYEYDPQQAIALDGALRKILDASYGPVLLAVVAGGLLCYALFCFVEARYRRV